MEELNSLPMVPPMVQQHLVPGPMATMVAPPPMAMNPILPLLPQHPVTPATAMAATVTTPTPALPTVPIPMQQQQQPDIISDQDRSKLSPTSMLPTLKYIDDPSLFDLDALTCHACNKSFKNTRAFKLHRDRHQVRRLPADSSLSIWSDDRGHCHSKVAPEQVALNLDPRSVMHSLAENIIGGSGLNFTCCVKDPHQ